MKRVSLSSLREGDFFRLKDDINSPLWVLGHYDVSLRNFYIYLYVDVNIVLLREPSVFVYVESY